MIRIVTAAALLALVALVLYLPAANAPEVFLRQAAIEHDMNLRLLGGDAALRIGDRTRYLTGQSAAARPIPSTFLENPAPPAVDAAVARHVAAAGGRLLDSEYVRSMQALHALSLYRLASLAEWLPLVSVFFLVAIVDGLIRRVVKSKEFLRHNPELFSVHICLAVLAGCGLALSAILPMTIHPYWFASALLLVGFFVNQATANFHARG